MGVFVSRFSEHYQREAFAGMEAMFRVDTNNIVSDLDTFTSRFWSEACRSRQALQSILVAPNVDNR